MKPFGGFPAKMQFTPVPNVFFSHLLPAIDDIDELRTTLAVFQHIYGKRGALRFTTYRELAGDAALVKGLGGGDGWETRLRAALDMMTARGTVLTMSAVKDQSPEDVYFLNTERDRQAIAEIQDLETVLPDLEPAVPPVSLPAEDLPDIFSLYEENIGMLTPMIAEQLRDAQKAYPETWLRDAIRQAAVQNKRKWSYIAAVLERWSAEGRTDGAYRTNSRKTDPDKYIKGKYGHMVQR